MPDRRGSVCWGFDVAGTSHLAVPEMRELKKRNRLLEQENEILRRAAAYLARDINPK